MKATGTSAEFWQWNSPVPYLYCGLGVVFATIAFALIYLFCCRQNSPSSEHLIDTDNNEEKKRHSLHPLDPEPKIVVVFSGNDKILYFAKPITYSPHAAQQV